jgi:hypothetical protein
LVWNDIGVGEMGQTHGLIASVNAAGYPVVRREFMVAVHRIAI